MGAVERRGRAPVSTVLLLFLPSLELEREREGQKKSCCYSRFLRVILSQAGAMHRLPLWREGGRGRGNNNVENILNFCVSLSREGDCAQKRRKRRPKTMLGSFPKALYLSRFREKNVGFFS